MFNVFVLLANTLNVDSNFRTGPVDSLTEDFGCYDSAWDKVF